MSCQKNPAFPTRIAMVTGAADGIGYAVTQRLLAEGYAVSVCDLDVSVHSIFPDERADGRLITFAGDISDESLQEELTLGTIRAFGGIDVVVNNAASGGQNAHLQDLNIDTLRHTFEVNVFSAIRLIQRAIAYLKESQAGRIVNLGSVFAENPVTGGTDYCTSKGAIGVLSRVLALELAPFGVTCNTVSPGLIKTRMHEEEAKYQADVLQLSAQERLEQLRQTIPLQRHGEPRDIADAVAWLASEHSGYVTGQTLGVNGGIFFH
jgi:NAD(P)-dependent dehydrogenase (short-subunit alcohol dehydrogenase family)